MFELKPYSRKELAFLYFPHCQTAKSACLSFRRLLDMSPKGTALKQSLHYRKHLTKAEVSAVIDILGEP
ncbi:MAG: DUF4248 domain-containing protein [Bacteroidetes bacterium]|nr:DUF4248 domain-containing protein [Bacteroidota bacterium]